MSSNGNTTHQLACTPSTLYKLASMYSTSLTIKLSCWNVLKLLLIVAIVFLPFYTLWWLCLMLEFGWILNHPGIFPSNSLFWVIYIFLRLVAKLGVSLGNCLLYQLLTSSKASRKSLVTASRFCHLVSRSRWGVVKIPNYESLSTAFPDLNAISNSKGLKIIKVWSPSKSSSTKLWKKS